MTDEQDLGHGVTLWWDADGQGFKWHHPACRSWWPQVICGEGTAGLPITYPPSLPVNTGITPNYAKTIGGVIQ